MNLDEAYILCLNMLKPWGRVSKEDFEDCWNGMQSSKKRNLELQFLPTLWYGIDFHNPKYYRTYSAEHRNTQCSTEGWKQDLLYQLARCGNDPKNVCRNLHRLMRRWGATFPVDLSVAPVTVALRRPFYQTQEVWWPCLRMSAWVRALWDSAPKMLLAGHSVEDTLGWQSTFADFWSKYKSFNGMHPLYDDGYDARFVVPYFLHGDEGRGQCRRQFMVESFQPCISWKGPNVTNESG